LIAQRQQLRERSVIVDILTEETKFSAPRRPAYFL